MEGKFPKTLDELKTFGYKFLNDASCRNCGADIEWYETPRGKKIPMNAMDKGNSPAVPHWKSCSEPEGFKSYRK